MGMAFRFILQCCFVYMVVLVYGRPFLAGGREVQSSISLGSEPHSLSTFAFKALQRYPLFAQANFLHVLSATKQVVAGYNHILEFETSIGRVKIVVWEQSWTGMLRITEAKCFPGQGQPSNLLDSDGSLDLDLNKYYKFASEEATHYREV